MLAWVQVTALVVTSWLLISQSDLSLNIREAHAFNTNDGFSLDVFVVDQIADQVRDCFYFQAKCAEDHWTSLNAECVIFHYAVKLKS